MKKIIVLAAVTFSMMSVQGLAAEGSMLNDNGYMSGEYTHLQESSSQEQGQTNGKADNDNSGGYYCEGDRCYYRGNK